MAKVADAAGSWSAPVSIGYKVDKVEPAPGAVTVTGDVDNWSGPTNGGATTSTSYTKRKDITVSYNPSDAG